ncbi:MAG: pantoate--beta-alanine ligase [Desulfobulbaceae bacterium]|uniref:Pantothenate synthetase n=1 Tax=Candidatus Desulfatifera sulfidica TaxID=2841691 RepID=A0A8J6T925_9BACT|nr:pantoate--beta-alanine ligase [Candidatus Desulfatifera sulfidica]
MKLIQTPEEMLEQVKAWRKEGLTIGLVPTMGCFHEGHLSLMRYARERADRVIVTLFVNPIQFGPGEDLAAYPRDLARDQELAAGEGMDVLYAPDAASMYPHGFQTTIRVGALSRGLCGASRPGHFDGVCTVVMKLFQQTRPHFSVFGEKDFQQLAVIRRMVIDLDLDIDIIGHPIVREPDGLAMSSRNIYLEGEERQQALCLSRAAALARELVASADHPLPVKDLVAELESSLSREPACTVDYVAVVDEETFLPPDYASPSSRLIMAVKINRRVRLIDNASLYHTT